MAEKLRVHHLANEIGVTSKAILQKCRDEDVDLKNHMSTVSAGLAATIRDWFSEGEHDTSIESAERVDLAKERAKRRVRKKKRAEAEKAAGEGVAAAVAEAEAPVAVEVAPPPEVSETPAVVSTPDVAVATPPPVEPSPMPTGPETPVPTPEAPPEEVRPAAEVTTDVIAETAPPPAESEAQAEPLATEPPEPVAETAAPETEAPPAEPEPIKPAGPQNIPLPPSLQGPRVIRVDAPEPAYRPPPRSGTGRRPGGRPGPTGFGQAPPTPPQTGRRGRRGGGASEFGREGELRKGGGGPGGPRARLHPRRTSRSADAGGGMHEWRDRDLEERRARLQQATERRGHSRRAVEASGSRAPEATRRTKAQVTEPILLHEFCSATGLSMRELWPKLMNEHGLLPQRNMALESSLAELLALDFGITLEIIKPKTALELLEEERAAAQRKHLVPRAPVVTFLGHVDHGKTSLLDAIRQTRVASGEAGGITQHIGAYRLDRGDKSVTFLDTPGHEAFTAMRARGAQLTDVVVLVVAADDGVMPQTTEAINHARAAQVPIVVALNKIDVPNADLNRVYGQLAEHQLVPVEWGGETDVIKTSAATGEGVDALVEHLAMLSDLMELKADATVPAQGTVIEAKMREGVGAVAHVLVQEGTLRSGNTVVCGPAFGRVRALKNDQNRTVKQAGPATPVEIMGLDAVPDAGDHLHVVKTLRQAKAIAEESRQQRREASLRRRAKPKTLEELLSQRDAAEIPELSVIVKADVQGSVDVLTKTLSEIPSDEVRLDILHAAVGGVSESDVVLAAASDAAIVGFQVVADPAAKRLADDKGVSIHLYRVIYELTDHIRHALEGIMLPEVKEEVRGKAEVRQIFRISRLGMVAGCLATEGVIARHHRIRVLRDLKIAREGAEIASLRRFKDDVKEVRAGMECGIKLTNFDDLHPGDVLEAYEVIEIRKKL